MKKVLAILVLSTLAFAATPAQVKALPVATLGFSAEVDIAFAYMFLDVALQGGGLTTAQVDAIIDAKQFLIDAFVSAVLFDDFNARADIVNAWSAILSTGLMANADFQAAFNSGQFFFGAHANSNAQVWVALWATFYAFFDLDEFDF